MAPRIDFAYKGSSAVGTDSKSPIGGHMIQVPEHIAQQLEAVKEDDEAVKKLGIELGTQMCQKLLDSGVPGLHMYTLNLDRSSLAILENLGLIKGRVRFWQTFTSKAKALKSFVQIWQSRRMLALPSRDLKGMLDNLALL